MQLTPNEKNIVDSILRSLKANVYVFGSRARGTARSESDLDLCLLAEGCEIPLDVIGKLREDFANSDLPFQVDLVDYFHLNSDFRSHIAKDMKQIK